MNDAELKRLVDDFVSGHISREQHEALQQELRHNPQSRATFRELIDLEASLQTWAAEDSSVARSRPASTPQQKTGHPRRYSNRRVPVALLAIAASIAVVVLSGWFLWREASELPQTAQHRKGTDSSIRVCLGTVRQEANSVWSSSDALTSGGRFSRGTISLASGIAELKFASGTDVVLAGPCQLRIDSSDTAQLLAGNIVVNVTELSDGFTLRTPDATILDEGTEYAVSLSDESTEVHVFEGSVIWEPAISDGQQAVEKIDAGQARRYSRSKPLHGARIPLGMRKFVRSLEAHEREMAGADLLAYDGFENLAGRIRRGRSGFGWAGGWESGFRGRGRIAEIVDTPSDKVFGIDRTGRRMLQLANGQAIRRDCEKTLSGEPGSIYFLSFLLRRAPGPKDSGRFFQISLSDSEKHRGRRIRPVVAFGITSDGLPFVKSGGKITQTAPPLEDDKVYFCVARIRVLDNGIVDTSLRVYQPGESIDRFEPTAWTTIGESGQAPSGMRRIRLAVGAGATCDVDELKIGTTWQSVTSATEEPR